MSGFKAIESERKLVRRTRALAAVLIEIRTKFLAGNYAKTAARGCGQYQAIVSNPSYTFHFRISIMVFHALESSLYRPVLNLK